MFKKLLVFGFLTLVALRIQAQIPAGYYDNASGKTGPALQQALHDVIAGHTQVLYADLWTYFQQTDKTPEGKVWDIYSDIPGSTPPYVFTFVAKQCGSSGYNAEGDCYNREHTFCQSWFKDGSPLYTDMFHLYPTDGYVNGRRSNYPFGEVGSAVWTSRNGSQLGGCASAGYSGTVFEPIDAYKGDIARGFFYAATRYYNDDAGFAGSDMVTGSQLKPWARALMLKWAKLDPVSKKETDRNNAIYAIQHNRNPFIDHPEYITKIWENTTGIADPAARSLSVFPNPASGRCSVILPSGINAGKISVSLLSAAGAVLNVHAQTADNEVTVNLEDLPEGLYCIRISAEGLKTIFTARVIKN